MLKSEIESRLAILRTAIPHLRRYARLFETGRDAADDLVQEALEALVLKIMKLDLEHMQRDAFREIRCAAERRNEITGSRRPHSRRFFAPVDHHLLFLTRLESFNVADAAHIVGISEALARKRLDRSRWSPPDSQEPSAVI